MDKFSKIYSELFSQIKKLVENCQYDNEFVEESNTFWMIRTKMCDDGHVGRLTIFQKATEPYHKIMTILRKNFPDSTDTRHKNDIESLLFRIFEDKNQNIEKISKDWLQQICTRKLKDYVCAYRIAGYPFSNSFKVDDVMLALYGSDEFKEFEKSFNESNDGVFVIKPKPGINAICVCNVKAYDDESCKSISNIYANRVLNFIKLLDPISTVRLEVKDYNMSYKTFIVSEGKTGISIKNILRNDCFQKRTYDFDKINSLKCKAEKFFFKKDITDFQKAILSALYWYGRVDVTYDDSVDQYISYINGLERLVLFDAEKDKTRKFAQRISCRYPSTDSDVISSLYKKRNMLLHENEPDIYEDELDMLRNLLMALILDMMEQNENHSNLYSYWRGLC